MIKDTVSQVLGFLSAVMLFLGTLNIKFDWLTESTISAFGVVLSAGILLVVNMYTVYKNHYSLTKKAKKQKEVLDKHDLK